MAKVNFKRYETNAEAEESDFIDGNFIATKEGSIYYDYEDERIQVKSGGSGSSDIIIVGDETEATEDTKLIVEEEDMDLDMQGADFLNEYSDSGGKGYSCNYINKIIKDTHSTDEVKTNKVWIDGKPIYQKIVEDLGVLDTSFSYIPSLNIDTLIDMRFIYKRDNDGNTDFNNFYNTSSDYFRIFWRNSQKSIEVRSSATNGTVTIKLEYTKTTD